MIAVRKCLERQSAERQTRNSYNLGGSRQYEVRNKLGKAFMKLEIYVSLRCFQNTLWLLSKKAGQRKTVQVFQKKGRLSANHGKSKNRFPQISWQFLSGILSYRG